jgi:hypothetical protein
MDGLKAVPFKGPTQFRSPLERSLLSFFTPARDAHCPPIALSW